LKTGKFRWIRWVVPVVVFLILLGVATIKWAQSSHGSLPVFGEVPDFTLTERSGEPFSRSDMNGNISVVCFFFTSCPGVCPRMGANLVQLYDFYHGHEGIQLISISVDPERDSLAALREYAKSWGVDDNGWVFLRGPMDSVVTLCEKGFMLPAENLPSGHSARFILVDGQGRIRGYYDGLEESTIDLLKKHIRLLVEEGS